MSVAGPSAMLLPSASVAAKCEGSLVAAAPPAPAIDDPTRIRSKRSALTPPGACAVAVTCTAPSTAALAAGMVTVTSAVVAAAHAPVASLQTCALSQAGLHPELTHWALRQTFPASHEGKHAPCWSTHTGVLRVVSHVLPDKQSAALAHAPSLEVRHAAVESRMRMRVVVRMVRRPP